VGKIDFHYVAFLRGINVGGRGLVKMADLKKAFVDMGFRNVRTLLASGNVLFESAAADPQAVAGEIAAGLKKSLNKDIGVAVRSRHELERIQAADPFRGIAVTPSIRLYVTFLGAGPAARRLSLPYSSPQGEFRLLRATPTEVFSVVDLARGKGTPELMSAIEKEFGADVTTRSWSTVLKTLA
jgi:uncharacterized protein (DUF1697 family)